MKHYILFGAYASYYTAKVRVYLRKKGIPFVERLPSDPVFRDTVRPASGTHRIPQVLTRLERFCRIVFSLLMP